MASTKYSPAQTLIFSSSVNRNSDENKFETFASFHPEFMVTLGALFVSYKDGQLWTHDDEPNYNNFYGVAYPSNITPIFNDKNIIKKKDLVIGYISDSNKKWYCPKIFTSIRNVQTGLRQESSLIEDDFKLNESVYSAGLLRDKNSLSDARKALLEGDFLGGNFISVKFEISAANSQSLVSLVDPYLTDIPSQRNL